MKSLKPVLIALVGIVTVIILGVFAVQSSQNKAISLEENVATAKSDIDTQLQRRLNVFTELAECVKQYDSHEYDTLKDVIAQRGNNMSDSDVQSITTQINAVAEQYPQLASSENYKELMNEISTTENLLAQFKQAYNKTVKEYNRYVRKFPTRIFLDMTGYEIVSFNYYETTATDTTPMNLFN